MAKCHAFIRLPTGTPLMDRQGRVTSPLSEVIYRLSNFVEAGVKPVFVFDGEPPRLKARTIQSRGEIKRKAEREWRGGGGKGEVAAAGAEGGENARPPGGEMGADQHRPGHLPGPRP